MDEEFLLRHAGLALSLMTGYRVFGPSFWKQFFLVIPLAIYLGALSLNAWTNRPYSNFLWLGLIPLYTLCSVTIYLADKRFKLTHWERDAE